MAGLGARQNGADRKFIADVTADASVSSGITSGRVMQPFPGFPGPATSGGVHLWVWLLIGVLVAGSVGVHFGLGRVSASFGGL